jgi:hypothetical protein
MEAIIEKPNSLSDFTGKTAAEMNSQLQEIGIIRARTLGHLAALVTHTHRDLKEMTWRHSINSNFDPEESYISVSDVQRLLSRMEKSVEDANERYEAIGTGQIINL